MERPPHQPHDRDAYGVDREFVDEALHPHPDLEGSPSGHAADGKDRGEPERLPDSDFEDEPPAG
jgi:hypothetical protein